MTKYRTIASVKKTLEILEFLSLQDKPASPQEIATAADLTVGTAMTHIATLLECGWIAIEGTHYRLGLKVAVLWARTRASLENERDNIDKHLQQIGVNE